MTLHVQMYQKYLFIKNKGCRICIFITNTTKFTLQYTGSLVFLLEARDKLPNCLITQAYQNRSVNNSQNATKFGYGQSVILAYFFRAGIYWTDVNWAFFFCTLSFSAITCSLSGCTVSILFDYGKWRISSTLYSSHT